MPGRPTSDRYPKPTTRRLRVFAFDPQASTRLDTALINQAVITLPWETDKIESPLMPGPVNDYLEVIDVDPMSGQFYEPVDLNHPHLLAQDGLAPSEGDPRFHQQMTFAVAMKTIKTFERALGRKILWAPERDKAENSGEEQGEYKQVPKLRIYPHALREANAYYSRTKKALLFGYFRADSNEAGCNLPGGWVFTALSHDVIVHETTHAILDGLHRWYAEPTSPDSLAFHEGFSDIVALFLHFTLPEAVADQISRMGGDLSNRTLLSELAQQFGEATGNRGALRSAIDGKEPDAKALSQVTTPHERGAILVAAVFDAFVTIYERRTADLLRIAALDKEQAKRNSGRLHPDLVKRLTDEAIKTADQVLRICIRALDYLPPVDVRFGEFLRAIITADTDLVRDDRLNYRLAFVEAFRRRGIFPENCLSLAPDSLLWEGPQGVNLETVDIKEYGLDLKSQFKRDEIFNQSKDNCLKVRNWFMKSEGYVKDGLWFDLCGLDDRSDSTENVGRGGKSQNYKIEIHSVRMTRRTGPEGEDLRQLVVEIIQQRKGFFNESCPSDSQNKEDFWFRGGATLIFDMKDYYLRYVIRKKISDKADRDDKKNKRLKEQRNYLMAINQDRFGYTYLGERSYAREPEPFAVTHRGM